MLNSWRSSLAAATPRSRLLVLLLLVSVGSTHCAPMTWNDESRMATIQAIVESRSLVIEHTDFASTGDKVFVDGHFYSDKPPMPAFLGAVVYFPLHLLGLHLHEGASAAYLLITWFTVGLAWIMGTLALFDASKFTALNQEQRFRLGAAVGFGSIFMTWATTFNNHELAAGFLSIGFACLIRARCGAEAAATSASTAGSPPGSPAPAAAVAGAGLFISLAGVCDIPTGIFYLLFFIHVVSSRTLRSKWLWYVLPLALTALPTAVANYSIHHRILPVQIYREYFDYPGSPWVGSPDLSGMQTNDPAFAIRYALSTLVGPMGFLLYNPLCVIALGGCVRSVAARQPFRAEAGCILLGSVMLMAYYWATTSNFGGWSYSIRWFVPLLPLLFFFLFPYLRDVPEVQGALAAHAGRLWRRKIFTALLSISIVIALVGALNPWSPLVYSEVPLVANLEQFLQHLLHPGRPYIKPRAAH